MAESSVLSTPSASESPVEAPASPLTRYTLFRRGQSRLIALRMALKDEVLRTPEPISKFARRSYKALKSLGQILDSRKAIDDAELLLADANNFVVTVTAVVRRSRGLTVYSDPVRRTETVANFEADEVLDEPHFVAPADTVVETTPAASTSDAEQKKTEFRVLLITVHDDGCSWEYVADFSSEEAARKFWEYCGEIQKAKHEYLPQFINTMTNNITAPDDFAASSHLKRAYSEKQFWQTFCDKVDKKELEYPNWQEVNRLAHYDNFPNSRFKWNQVARPYDAVFRTAVFF